MSKPLINPGMKVAALLDHWPELEEVLVAQAPAFQKLRHPILRRTVARVATLEQAAGIAGISVRDLVMTLREAVGQPVEPGATGDAEDSSGGRLQAEDSSGGRLQAEDSSGGRLQAALTEGPPPAWFDPARVVTRIDADALLAAGQVPLTAAFAAARALKPGEILEVTASFRPVPLVENLTKQRYRCFLRGAPDTFHLYATPEPPGQGDAVQERI
jgi:hypothetical protein